MEKNPNSFSQWFLLMGTDEYQEGLNTTKVSSGIPNLTFEAE